MNATNKNTPDNKQSGFLNLKKTAIIGATIGALTLGSGSDGKAEQVDDRVKNTKAGVSEVLKHNPVNQLPIDLSKEMVLKGINGDTRKKLTFAKLDVENSQKGQEFSLKDTGKTKEQLHKIYNDNETSHEAKILIEKLLKEGIVKIEMPTDDKTALDLENIGIKVPIENIKKYNELYVKYLDGLDKYALPIKDEKGNVIEDVELTTMKKEITDKNKEIFDGLILVSKFNALNIMYFGLQGELKGINPELNVRTGAVEITAAIDNFINYYEGGTLDKRYLSLNINSYVKKFPGVKNILKPEKIQFLNDVKVLVKNDSEKKEEQNKKIIAENTNIIHGKDKKIDENDKKIADNKKIIKENENIIGKMKGLLSKSDS